MLDTIVRYLDTGAFSERARAYLMALFNPIGDRLSTQGLTNSTLVIGSVSKKVPKTGAADSYFSVKGKLVKIDSGTAMPAISGTISASATNVVCFFVDSAGTTSSLMGTEATTLANVVWPAFPENKALIGFIIITQSAGGPFTGGSTDLDDGTSTVVYVSPVGAFDPSVLLR